MTNKVVNPFEQYKSKHLYDIAIKSPAFVVLAHRLAGTSDINEWNPRFFDVHDVDAYYNQRIGFDIVLPYGLLEVNMCVRQGHVWDSATKQFCPADTFTAYSHVVFSLPQIPIKTNWYDSKLISTDGRSRSVVNGARNVADLGIDDGNYAKKFQSAAKALTKAIDELDSTHHGIIKYALERAKSCTSKREEMYSVYQTLVASEHFDAKQIDMLRHIFKESGLL